jgi:hypothetical protein
VILGKLQTWSLIAHGITSNPNDLVDGSGSGLGGNKKDATATNMASPVSSKDHQHPSVVEFDGSVNTIAVQPNDHPEQTHPFAANSDIAAADSSVSILSTSVASSPSSSANCAKVSNNGHCLGWCLLILLAFSFSLNSSLTRDEQEGKAQRNTHQNEKNGVSKYGVISSCKCSTDRINSDRSGSGFNIISNCKYNCQPTNCYSCYPVHCNNTSSADFSTVNPSQTDKNSHSCSLE